MSNTHTHTHLCLMSSIQDKLGKSVTERQTILDFNNTKDDGGGAWWSCQRAQLQSDDHHHISNSQPSCTPTNSVKSTEDKPNKGKKVKVHTHDIAPLRSESPPQKR